MTSISLTLALAVATSLSRADLDRAGNAFETAYPHARIVRAANGGLEHASGFAAVRFASGDEENARAFLASEGLAFGVSAPTDLLLLRVLSAPGADGSALFQRMANGLPVFAGLVAVGWRSDGAITVVNGARVLAAAPQGSFRASADAARGAALAAAPGTPGEARVEQGWLQYEGVLYPAFRVEHDATDPMDGFVSYVDGESGRLLYRVSRKHTAAALHPCPVCSSPPCVCAFRDSPLAPPTTDPNGNAPEAFKAQELIAPGSGSHLDGLRTSIFDCLGADATSDSSVCTAQSATTDGSGNFLADPDSTLRRIDDEFAEQSAYYHIDAHSRFLDGLDPAFAGRTAAGGIGKVFAYVNVLQGGAPFDNAFFSPTGGPAGSSGVMVYGQGTFVDVSYDAEIVYHELTHAAVDVTASFEEYTDRFGANHDPGSMNEGTADTFAFAHVAEALVSSPVPPADGIASASCLSRYFGAELGLACLRQSANAKTCRGNGPNDGRNPGRDGEVHDDGEIWTGFTWALLAAAHDNGGDAMRQLMEHALFKALGAVGPHSSIPGYAATVRQKMSDVGMPQQALDFADCTILQRDIAGCGDDRTGRAVALFSGERARGVFSSLASQGGTTTAGQQYFIDVPCSATELNVQTGDSTGKGQLYLRHGKPIEFTAAGLGGAQYDWMVGSNQPEVALTPEACEGCDLCSGAQTPFGPGRWYFLPSGSLAGDGGNANAFELGVSLELPSGESAPQRVEYTIGAAGTAEPNACTWGAGATPSRPIPPVPIAPPALEGCAAPVAPAVVTPPASCRDGLATTKSGCGCGAGAPGGTAVVLLGLLALRRWAV